jgi:hypothetical protein
LLTKPSFVILFTKNPQFYCLQSAEFKSSPTIASFSVLPFMPRSSKCFQLLSLQSLTCTFQIEALSRVIPVKPTIAPLHKNFPTCYGTRMFITVFTRARYRAIS